MWCTWALLGEEVGKEGVEGGLLKRKGSESVRCVEEVGDGADVRGDLKSSVLRDWEQFLNET